MEPLVRVARHVAAIPLRSVHRGTAAAEPAGCSAPLCRKSIRGSAAEAGPRGDVSLLVHRHEDEARTGTLVAKGAVGQLRAGARARERRQNRAARFQYGRAPARVIRGASVFDFCYAAAIPLAYWWANPR